MEQANLFDLILKTSGGRDCESSSERGARVSELLEYDTSRTKLDSLMT